MGNSVDFAVQHTDIDPDNWDDIYIVGDPHGCRAAVDRLREQLGITESDLLVFVGDLVRKGPDSKGVIDLVRTAPNMVTVRGNNEEKLLRGNKTLPELTEADLDWIASRPLVITLPETLVVHAGVDPRTPRADHTVDDLQNVRSMVPDASYQPPFWFDRYDGPERVFFGHTVLEEPIIRDHAVGLDTGCVYGNRLTAFNWRTVELETIEPTETFVERPAERFITPPVGQSI
jgi:serine/threonine protein phosphatase 1